MTDQTLHCREAFEKWLREEVFKNFSSTNGQEEERLSRLHWPTWQAAWNTRSNAQGVTDELVERFEEALYERPDFDIGSGCLPRDAIRAALKTALSAQRGEAG